MREGVRVSGGLMVGVDWRSAVGRLWFSCWVDRPWAGWCRGCGWPEAGEEREGKVEWKRKEERGPITCGRDS